MGGRSTTSTQRLCRHIRFNPCLSVAQFAAISKDSNSGLECLYVHHFFSGDLGNKLNWPADFRIHICCIPTSFDVFVFSTGTEPEAGAAWAIKTLETSHAFPGGFVPTAEIFMDMLKALEANVASADYRMVAFRELRTNGDYEGEEAGKRKRFKHEENSLWPTNVNIGSESVSFVGDSRYNREFAPCPWTCIPGSVVASAPCEFPKEPGVAGEDRFWISEVLVPMTPGGGSPSGTGHSTPTGSSSGGTHRSDNAVGFARVHKRIEWLMHFYIDAFSPIEVEPRWRIYIILRSLSNPGPLSLTAKDIVSHAKHLLETSAGHAMPHQTKDDMTVTGIASDGTIQDPHSGAHPGAQPGGLLPNDDHLSELLHNAPQPYEILGIVTAYQFFAFPKDRIRISQFFVMPHRQRLGIGRVVLSLLSDMFCADPQIREIAVEDPAPGFKRLRDFVSIERALREGLLSVSCLWPSSECPNWDPDKAPYTDANWPRYDQVLKATLFESKGQRRRVRLILALASCVPQSVIESQNVGASFRLLEPELEHIGPLRRKWKFAHVNESLDYYSSIPEGLASSVTHAKIDKEWRVEVLSMLSVIARLRACYPLTNESL